MAPGATDAAPAGASPAGLDYTKFYNVIDGKLTSTVQTRHSVNPATEKPNPEVPVASQADVDTAVAAGLKAFRSWSQTEFSHRQKLLNDFADALEKEKEHIVKLLVEEQGKPVVFAGMEFAYSVACIRIIAGLALPTQEIVEGDLRILQRYVPLGLAVGIVPWNFPLVLAVGKIAPCVLAGSTMIIKPSPFTPYCGLKVCELANAIFPPGVVQALSGDHDLGEMLTSHPGPAKITFTGSTATGKKVMASASKTLKRLTLELGGNDPAIVCEDVDLDDVAAKVAGAAFLNAGQLCLAVKRILVHESIYEPFKAALVKATKNLRYGPGTEEGVFLGPIQNCVQYERVKTFFDDIAKTEQKIVVGGTNPEGTGYFIQPTIVEAGKKDRIVVEEPFGPIVPVLSFSTDEEAIAMANDTEYGLGGSVWSKDIERANAMAAKIEAGSVWVNRHYYLDARLPYGGMKESGIGVEWGVGGLTSFCNSQTLYLAK